METPRLFFVHVKELSMKEKETLGHSDFLALKKLVFDRCNLKCSEPLIELESSDYAACSFEVNGSAVRFRVAKVTPTKVGQFVTLWKRTQAGPIAPYDFSDTLDLFIVCVRSGQRFGHFVFPKSVLVEHDVLSINGKGGKRALRVYPPWDSALNKQAQKTQQWQINYFLEIFENQLIDCAFIQKLYQNK